MRLRPPASRRCRCRHRLRLSQAFPHRPGPCPADSAAACQVWLRCCSAGRQVKVLPEPVAGDWWLHALLRDSHVLELLGSGISADSQDRPTASDRLSTAESREPTEVGCLPKQSLSIAAPPAYPGRLHAKALARRPHRLAPACGTGACFLTQPGCTLERGTVPGAAQPRQSASPVLHCSARGRGEPLPCASVNPCTCGVTSYNLLDGEMDEMGSTAREVRGSSSSWSKDSRGAADGCCHAFLCRRLRLLHHSKQHVSLDTLRAQ